MIVEFSSVEPRLESDGRRLRENNNGSVEWNRTDS